MHNVISWHIGLEVEGDLPRDSRQDGEQIPRVALPLQNMAQRLNEPRPCGRVAPAVEPGNGRVRDQEVGMRRNLVGGVPRVRLSGVSFDHVHPLVQLIALASLGRGNANASNGKTSRFVKG